MFEKPQPPELLLVNKNLPLILTTVAMQKEPEVAKALYMKSSPPEPPLAHMAGHGYKLPELIDQKQAVAVSLVAITCVEH